MTSQPPVENHRLDGRTETASVGDPAAPQPTRHRLGRRALVIAALAAVLLAAALAVGTIPRWRQQRAVDAVAATTAAAAPRVTVTVAQRMATGADRVLPGNSLPLLEASLFARTNGYLKSRSVDIGDRVKEGQLL